MEIIRLLNHILLFLEEHEDLICNKIMETNSESSLNKYSYLLKKIQISKKYVESIRKYIPECQKKEDYVFVLGI